MANGKRRLGATSDFAKELERLREFASPGAPPVKFKRPKVDFKEMSVAAGVVPAFGEVALDFFRDIVGVPQRLSTVISNIPQAIARNKIVAQRVDLLEKTGLNRKEALDQVKEEFLAGKLPELNKMLNPDEAAAALDLLALALPLGKVARTLGKPAEVGIFRTFGTTPAALAERGVSLPQVAGETVRALGAGAKAGAVIPPKEIAGKPAERAQFAGEVGAISAPFPFAGTLVRLSGVPEAISNSFAKMRRKLGGAAPADEVLARAAREELKAILRQKPVKDALAQEGGQLGRAINASAAALDEFGQLILEEGPAITAKGTIGQAAKPGLRTLAREQDQQILAQRMKGLLGEAKAQEVAPSVAKRLSSVGVSPQRIRTTNTAINILTEQIKEFSEQVAGKAANTATVEQAIALGQLANALGRQLGRFRRTFGLTGLELQRPVTKQTAASLRSALGTMRTALKAAGVKIEALGVLESEKAPTMFREAIEMIRTGRPGRGLRLLTIDFWRRAIFPFFSFVADLNSNIAALGERAQRDFTSDVLDFVRTGSQGERTAAHFDAIRYWRRFPARELEKRMGIDPTLSERFRPFFGEKADIAVFTGLKMKTLVDSTARALAFKTTVLGKAREEAVSRGLKGIERQNFIRARIPALLNDTQLIAKAVEEGERASFTLPLPKSLERSLSNPFVLMFVTPFGRFGVQWLRFLAEFTPVSPSFTKKLFNGTATADDAVAFALRNLEGAGFIQFTNEVVYDDVDFNTLEYKFHDIRGNVTSRKSLRGIPLITESLFVNAILRNEPDKALKALLNSSVTFLASEGIASRLVEAARDMAEGRGSLKTLRRRMEEFISGFIPQRTILSVFEQLLSPDEKATGFRGIPGLSESGEKIIDPFTGEPRRTQRVISGTDIDAPAALGSRVLSRKLRPEEEYLKRIGIEKSVRFPLIREKGASKPSDTSPETTEKFQRIWGQLHGRLVRGLAQEFPAGTLNDPLKQRAARELYGRMRSEVTKLAKLLLQAQGVELAKD